MYHHVKKLMYTVRVDEPDPKFGNMLLEQFGGANGELGPACGCVQRSARGNERAYIFWSIVGRRAPPLAFPLWREFRRPRVRAANRRLSEDTSRSAVAIPA